MLSLCHWWGDVPFSLDLAGCTCEIGYGELSFPTPVGETCRLAMSSEHTSGSAHAAGASGPVNIYSRSTIGRDRRSAIQRAVADIRLTQ